MSVATVACERPVTWVVFIRIRPPCPLVAAFAIPTGHARSTALRACGPSGRPAAVTSAMAARLTHACVITADVPRLREFYARVLDARPSADRPEYVEFQTPGGALSMYRHAELERYAPGATSPAKNRSVMIEFEVQEVDAEVERLAGQRIEWVMPPTTQSWGNRATYLRDPDGNL